MRTRPVLNIHNHAWRVQLFREGSLELDVRARIWAPRKQKWILRYTRLSAIAQFSYSTFIIPPTTVLHLKSENYAVMIDLSLSLSLETLSSYMRFLEMRRNYLSLECSKLFALLNGTADNTIDGDNREMSQQVRGKRTKKSKMTDHSCREDYIIWHTLSYLYERHK